MLKTKRLDWIGFFLTLLGLVLNANKIILCWPVWLASNYFWTKHFWKRHEKASIAMNVALAVFNIYGWYVWS